MNQQTILGIGILVIFIGIIILIVGSILNFNKSENKSESKTDSKIAVVGFLGPIPFGFGNDKEMLKWGLVIGFIILMIMIIIVSRLK